jgi:hypothetical protein
MNRRVWLVGLVLYLIAAVADVAVRIDAAINSGETLGPAVIAVSLSAGLFWPIDVVARWLW